MLRAIIVSSLGMLFAACVNIGAANASVQDDVDQAVTIIERFQAIPEKAIPDSVLRNAKGLAILTVTKAGFIGSGRGGSGIVVARTGNGWSGPFGNRYRRVRSGLSSWRGDHRICDWPQHSRGRRCVREGG